jgi:hypothetical protein
MGQGPGKAEVRCLGSIRTPHAGRERTPIQACFASRLPPAWTAPAGPAPAVTPC